MGKKNYSPKLQQKRNTALEKAWYILKPFIIYTIVKTVALLILSMVIPEFIRSFTGNAEDIIQHYSKIISAVSNSLASIIGVLFVVNDFVKEVAVTGEINIDNSVMLQLWAWIKTGVKESWDKLIQYGAVISLGITMALSLNIVVELMSVSSEKYDSVEAIQYSVPLWLGLILYGVVSPVVEEIVFRGVTFNRMKRYFSIPASVIATSILFGLFHGNLPQFIYGTVMGIFMALCYHWVKSFGAPLLFHMSANIFVFVFSTLYGDAMIVSWGFFAVFLILSIVIMIFIYSKRDKKQQI